MFNNKEYYIKNRERILRQRKLYHENNAEKVKEWGNRYRKNHKEEIIERNKQWNKDNPEYLKEYIKQYRIVHKERIAKLSKIRYNRWLEKNDNKEYISKYHNNKRKMDLKCNLNHKISGQIYKSLKRNKNGWHWETLTGYTLTILIKHLKKTMPEGYTWNDYLNGKLHIDHIIPIAVFHFDKAENPDFQKCWSLKNLRLLPAKENISKGAKISKPFQPSLQLFLKL